MIALTVVAATTVVIASPAQAEPNTIDCTDVAINIEYTFNMYEWSEAFYGAQNARTLRWFEAYVAYSELSGRYC